jgi:hypothetical protein
VSLEDYGPGRRAARSGGRGPFRARRLSVLLLADDDPAHAGTILEHIGAFRAYSQHHVRVFNPRWLTRSRYLDLHEFDVLVIHYSLCVIVDNYLSADFRAKIRDFGGLKVQFIQDDYRWVNDISAAIRDMRIDVLLTLVPPREIPRVWSDDRLPGVVKINTLAGYVPDGLVGRAVEALADRPVDIGYRGRTLPYWLGRLGQEKVWIAQGVLARAAAYDLRCDIAWTEADRIYGDAWDQFIASCRATLGTESGSSITDFDGSIERQVSAYLAEHPGADFEEVFHQILWGYEGNVHMNVVSPRVFEAIALRTPMILFPGEYSGVIEPGRHYIVLEKDFSNFGEVVDRLRDVDGLEEMVRRVHRDVVESGRYSLRRFIEQFDAVVSEYGWGYGRRTKLRFGLAALDHAGMLPRIRIRVPRWRRPRLGTSFMRARWTLIALRLTLRHAETRAMLVRWMVTRGVRREVSFGRLFADALRLGLLLEVAAGRLGFEEPARLEVRLNGDRVLELITRQSLDGLPGTETARRQSGQGGAECTASVAGMRWTHEELGGHIVYPSWLPGSQGTTIPVGPEGVRDFAAFSAIARRYPREAHALVLTLLGRAPGFHVPPRRRPGLEHASPPSRRARRVRQPYRWRKLVFGLARILRHYSLSRIAVRYLVSPRLWRELDADMLFRDLVRLALLRGDERALSRAAGERIALTVEIHDGLVLRTVPVPPGARTVNVTDLNPAISESSLTRIVWDHSAVGDRVMCRSRLGHHVAFTLEPRGLYEFRGLVQVACRYPLDVQRALSTIVRVRGRYRLSDSASARTP